MSYLNVSNDFIDPEGMNLEIVERKGLGHPDTLADSLAELISMDYSNFCLKNFGVVLHHNIDKLYIGAGLFKSSFGYCERVKPVKVVINGRMSNEFGGQNIDLGLMQKNIIHEYLNSVVPHLKSEDILIDSNATQNSKLPFWFSPRDKGDLPEYAELRAGDNAVCVFSWPLTVVENLVYSIENYFWDKTGKFPKPKFNYLGQDIKVMAHRQGKNINVGVRVPILSEHAKDEEIYKAIIENVRCSLSKLVDSIVRNEFNVDLEVNARRPYLLGVGSCIECGEEGLVGRGNSNSGLISVFRPHSVEAPSGKNPVYHTGRVLNFLTMNLSKGIYNELGAKNTVTAITKNGGLLVPPFSLSISLDRNIESKDIQKIVKKHFLDVDYLSRLLSERQVK